jgi:hypothetical protein
MGLFLLLLLRAVASPPPAYFPIFPSCPLDILFARKVIFLYIFIIPLSLFWKKIKVGLCDRHSVCLWIPPPSINYWMLEPILMKLGMYIMAIEPISTACLINPSHQVCYVCICIPVTLLGNCWVETLPRQQIHTTIEELIVGRVAFTAVGVVSKENKQLFHNINIWFPFNL